MPQEPIVGTEYNDFLTDTISDDEIFALEGDDQIELNSGNDSVDGGEGNDELIINYDSSNEDVSISLYSYFNGLSNDGSIDIYFPSVGNSSHISFHSIESFMINSGSGHDTIDLGYDNFSDDVVNAGGGNDYISAGLGNDTVDGGSGFDVLRLDFTMVQNGVVSSLSDNNSGEYDDGFSTISFRKIEALEVMGSNYNDVLVALTSNNLFGSINPYPMNSMIDGGEGKDQLVADYSDRSEDLMFNFSSSGYYDSYNNYSMSGSIDVNAYTNGNYSSYLNFNNIESFVINSGSGHDTIDLGYDNFSDDQVDAGAGDDYISTGLGNDTVDGGSGFDVLRLDFTMVQNGVVSSLKDSNSGEYDDGFSTISFRKIEALEVMGSNYNDVLVALTSNNLFGSINPYPMNSMIDGGEGKDQLVADYSDRSEDLMFNFSSSGYYDSYNNYSMSGSIDVNAYTNGNYSSYLNFNNIESFVINSGSGHDTIDLGYDNFSNDMVNAGGGDDYISTGAGNDTIKGGRGNDVYIYEGYGVDVISDSAGDNDTIIFGSGITLDNLSLNFDNSDLIFSFNDSPEDKLILENYVDSIDKIENIDIEGQIYTIE